MHTIDSQHDHELLVLLRCVKGICDPKSMWGKMSVYHVHCKTSSGAVHTVLYANTRKTG